MDETGELLNGVTLVVFGAALLWPTLEGLTWRIALYAVASLTIVRMLPVAIAMLGTGARRQTVAFLGWFGPRGLASIVFAVLVVEEADLPHTNDRADDVRDRRPVRTRSRVDGGSACNPLCVVVRLAPSRREPRDGERPGRVASMAAAGSTVSMEVLLLTWYRHFGRDLPWRQTPTRTRSWSAR